MIETQTINRAAEAIRAETFQADAPFKEAMASVAVRKAMPTSLGSKALGKLTKAIKQRAQFSAKTTNAWYLDQISGVTQDILSGKTNMATARLHLQGALNAIGYQPDSEGLQDLGSFARLNLIINTQLGLATGYGQRLAAVDPDIIDAFPAWRLSRWENRISPRDWTERWAIAAAGTPQEGRNDDEFIALKDHPIWDNLGDSGLFDDALDVNYPPFAFQSGMGLDEINRTEAEEAGVIDVGQAAPTPEVVDFNDSLQATADYKDSDLLDLLLQDKTISLVDGVLVLAGAN